MVTAITSSRVMLAPEHSLKFSGGAESFVTVFFMPLRCAEAGDSQVMGQEAKPGLRAAGVAGYKERNFQCQNKCISQPGGLCSLACQSCLCFPPTYLCVTGTRNSQICVSSLSREKISFLVFVQTPFVSWTCVFNFLVQTTLRFTEKLET